MTESLLFMRIDNLMKSSRSLVSKRPMPSSISKTHRFVQGPLCGTLGAFAWPPGLRYEHACAVVDAIGRAFRAGAKCAWNLSTSSALSCLRRPHYRLFVDTVTLGSSIFCFKLCDCIFNRLLLFGEFAEPTVCETHYSSSAFLEHHKTVKEV